MSKEDLALPRTVVAGVLESRLADGYVLLQPDTGEYYGLDVLGSDLWDALKRGVSPIDFIRDRAGDFDVPPERFQQDIAALIADLERCRLIASEPA